MPMPDPEVRFILERLDQLREDIADLRKHQVCRPEHVALEERVTKLEHKVDADARSRHTPWPMIVSAVCAAIAIGFSLYS